MRPLVKRYYPLYMWKFNGEILVIVYDIKFCTETYFTYNDWNTKDHQNELCMIRKIPYTGGDL